MIYFYLACPMCGDELDSPEQGVYYCQECGGYTGAPEQVMVTVPEDAARGLERRKPCDPTSN